MSLTAAARARTAAILLVLALLSGLLTFPAQAALPGGNGKLAFVREGAIVSTSASGGNVKRLAAAVAVDPSWSANGRKIVYIKFAEGIGGFGPLMVMNADGSGKKQIAPESRYNNPSFSPDGRKVIVTEYDGNAMGEERLLVMSATDGSGRGKFAPNVNGTMRLGAWSPDGTRVAYIDSAGALVRIAASGRPASRKQLVRDNSWYPDWSPDGSRLVFGRSSDGSSGTAVYRINADGSGLRKLAAAGEEPVWSPNGRRILYMQPGNDGYNLMSMKPDGSDKTLVTRNGTSPSWQPLP